VLEHHTVDARGVLLHVVAEGQGPPVVLLHGFPEFWYSWRHQLPALAAGGLRALAPDLRGYGRSDKPPGVAAYHVNVLAADVAAIIRSLGGGRAAVVGHDWGAAIAFHVAARYPALVERLAIINGPQQGAMLRAMLSLAQLRRSWYMFFFQLPWLPERQLLRPGFVRRLYRHHLVDPEAVAEHELRRFEEALHQPGVATAALNYYRAAFRDPMVGALPVSCPGRIIWGMRDRALGPEVLEAIEPLVPHGTTHVVPDGGHFVHEERPDEVNRVLLDFLHPAA
jgi:pimeloyl-ACP methyl ester carboxylesterase